MAEKLTRNPEKKEATAPQKPATAAKQPAPAKKPQQTIANAARPAAAAGKSTVGLRVGACLLWLLAIACEVFAVMALMKDFSIRFGQNAQTNVLLTVILFLVLDLALCIVAAQLWKKANRIKPMSEKRGKFLFYLWAEMGLIMLALCFVPVIIALFKSKKLDQKTKTITAVIAIVAVLLAGLFSADWNPITQEQKEEAEAQITTNVYWTTFGHKYHLAWDENGQEGCPYIRNSEPYVGTVTEAIETGRTAICSYCARTYAEELGLTLEDLNVEDKEAVAPQVNVNTGEITTAPTATGGN